MIMLACIVEGKLPETSVTQGRKTSASFQTSFFVLTSLYIARQQ